MISISYKKHNGIVKGGNTMIIKTLSLDEEDKNVFVNTYILNDYPKYYQQDKRPAVVICPGGGYSTLARKEGEPVALKMNTMGYHAFVLHYSIGFTEKPSEFINEEDLPPRNLHAAWPIQLYQVQKVFQMIKDHAQEWNVDSDQIMLMGFSAGGHLSASYATFGREIMGDIYIKPVALILGYARLDMLECDYKEKLERPSGRILTKYKNLVLFGTENPTEEQRMALDPLSHIYGGMPPVFIWHMQSDQQIKSSQALNFAIKLFEYHVPHEIHIFSSGVHGCALADKVCASQKDHYDESCEMWPELLRRWLKRVITENTGR